MAKTLRALSLMTSLCLIVTATTATTATAETYIHPSIPTATPLLPRQLGCLIWDGPYEATVCPGIAQNCRTPTCTTWKTVTVAADNTRCTTRSTMYRAVATCLPYCPEGCKTVVKTVVLPKTTLV